MAQTLSYSESWVKRFIPFIAVDKGVDLSFYCTRKLQHLTCKSTADESATDEKPTDESATVESTTDEKDIWKIPAKHPNAPALLVYVTPTFSGMPNFTFDLAVQN